MTNGYVRLTFTKRLPETAQKIAPRLLKPRGLTITHLYSFTSPLCVLPADTGIYAAHCVRLSSKQSMAETRRQSSYSLTGVKRPPPPLTPYRFMTSYETETINGKITLNASFFCRRNILLCAFQAPVRFLTNRSSRPSAQANFFRRCCRFCCGNDCRYRHPRTAKGDTLSDPADKLLMN